MTAVEQGLSPSKGKYFLSWERSNGFPVSHAQPSPRLEEGLRDRVDKWKYGQTYPHGNEVKDPLVAHDCHELEKTDRGVLSNMREPRTELSGNLWM